MRRIAVAGLTLALAAACRPYDLRSTVTDQDGLLSGTQYARFGADQAKAVAIGRALAQWDGGQAEGARADQVTRAAEYAKTIPGVKTVVADTLGYRLTVTFASGWRTAIMPVADGVKPEDTPGIK